MSFGQYNAPAGLQLAGVAGFLVPLIVVPNILIRVFDAPILQSLVIGGIFAAAGSRLAGNYVEKKMRQAKEAERKRRLAEREAQTQQQIDTMLRGNSKIPKVKR